MGHDHTDRLSWPIVRRILWPIGAAALLIAVSITIAGSSYDWLANILFFLPALIALPLSVGYFAFRATAEDDLCAMPVYAMIAVLLWVLSLGSLVSFSLVEGKSAFDLFFASSLQRPQSFPQLWVGLPAFAFVGVLGYASFSVAKNRKRHLTVQARNAIMSAVAQRILMAPYLATVLVYLLGISNDPALAIFAGLFTGMWIKVVMNILNEAGTKLLPQRVQEELEDRFTRKAPDGLDDEPGDDQPSFADVADVLDQHRDELLGYAGVTGTAVGYKQQGSLKTRQRAIVVFVEEKTADAARRIPAMLDGRGRSGHAIRVPTDVIASPIPEVAAWEHTCENNDVRAPGCQIFNEARKDHAGTFGAMVKGSAGQIYMLSCYHVMRPPKAKWSAYSTEDDANAGIMCPSPTGDFTIAQLVRGTRTQYADVAVATLTNLDRISSLLPYSNSLPKGVRNISRATPQAEIGRLVLRMCGARSGTLSQGTLEHVGATRFIKYSDGVVRFDELLLAKLGARTGDSGSLVVDTAGYAIGVVLAVAGDYTYLMPWARVADAAQAELLTR